LPDQIYPGMKGYDKPTTFETVLALVCIVLVLACGAVLLSGEEAHAEEPDNPPPFMEGCFYVDTNGDCVQVPLHGETDGERERECGRAGGELILYDYLSNVAPCDQDPTVIGD
jgi:hypothetical protein